MLATKILKVDRVVEYKDRENNQLNPNRRNMNGNSAYFKEESLEKIGQNNCNSVKNRTFFWKKKNRNVTQKICSKFETERVPAYS